MRRKTAIFMLLLWCVIICANCGGKKSGDSSENGGFREKITSSETEENDSTTETGFTDEQSTETLKSFWPYYEEDGVSMGLLIGNSNEGKLEMRMRFACYEEKDIRISLKNVMFNDSVRSMDSYFDYEGKKRAGEDSLNHVIYHTDDDWTVAIQNLPFERIQSLSFLLVISNIIRDENNVYDNYEVVLEKQIQLSFPEEYEYGLIFEPYLEAAAEKQVLLEDDTRKISLIQFGGYFSINRVQPEIAFEFTNKTDNNLTINIPGVIVNGMYFQDGASAELRPHQTMFKSGELSGLEKQELDSIQELSVLVTSYKKWYEGEKSNSNGVDICPVVLSQSGVSKQEWEKGTTLYEKNGLRIGLRQNVQREECDDGRIKYTWYFSIFNDTDDFQKLDIASIKKDDELLNLADSIFPSTIGPHSMVYSRYDFYCEEKEERPTISLYLNVINAANDSLLYQITEPIVLHTEE